MSGLVANNGNPAAIAALEGNGGGGPTNPFSNTSNIVMTTADARAIGFVATPSCVPTVVTGQVVPKECGNGAGTVYDGIISFNTSITSPPNSSGPSLYSLVSVAVHEIDEVLGLGSALENCNPNDPSSSATCKAKGTLTLANDSLTADGMPEDLYRWNGATTGASRANQVNCLNPGTAVYSYGPGTGTIAGFNNARNGGDFADWNSAALRVQKASGTPGY